MKTENKVSLEQVLWSREKRVATQKELLEKYPGTLICFMLNIPGPEKVNKLFEKVFYEGLEKIQNKLETEKISTEVRLVQENITGYEGYLVVKADGCRVKKLMIALEETKIGRLYDIDVLEKENTKISRNDLGFPERKCLLCDNPACQCGRSRKHSIEELRKKIYDIIWEEQLQRGVAAEISQALMEEVYTTPKPGLVDREDTGAHTDMDCQTFQKSTEAIAEDLAAMFEAGYSWEADPETLFPLLRERGKKTEEKMFAATGGVNTHKGIIFTIGILAAAAGISLRNYGKIESESVCRISLEMTKKELEQDLRKLKQSSGITHGEKIYCHLGEKGVRGLAMTGYPILCELTVPHMKQYIANNRDKNQINVQILLEIIAELTDTNVISRTSEKEMRWLQTEAKAILKAGGAFSENGLQKVRELNQIYDERAAKKGIRYEIDWKNGTYSHSTLVGNPVYLGRILSNIMDNAIKFSQSGSVLTLGVKEETLDDDRANFTFYCKDQGVGMSEDFIAHAFDMFSQESKTSRSRYEGTGLGLAITKQLVDRMDGSIELKSKAGVGTTVIVKIPFKIGTQDKNSNLSDKPVSLDDYSVEGMRALVVEDNELNMEIARCILEESGMEVTCAVDGQEAVEIFEKSAPDYFGVIYMDIMMPRLNGLDAARTIREMKRRDARRVPIIAMSANSFAEDIINSRLAGMNVHLAKPLDAEKMIIALKQCMADNSDVKLHEDL